MKPVVFDSLAFGVQQSPGLYAVLLGSGVSRAAGVPTGWEVMKDLTSKVAAQNEEDPGDEPVSWWCEYSGEDPDYSKLLETLAPTQPARQAILRDYFEPDEEEREKGLKQPTRAHRAIARLVSLGKVRIILTTNFDRLMETALKEAGVEPTVLSTPTAMEGALPLAHERCVVVKLHGDYLDTRLRNTVAELASYPARQKRLLRRVFDEYGLIICGWSGDWDPALREELERTKQRRFPNYWALKGKKSDAADKLISQRQAHVIEIDGADSFFDSLAERVQSLDEFERRPPQSTSLAVAELKRYLPEQRHRIRLHDLVMGETEVLCSRLAEDNFPLSEPKPTPENSLKRLQHYDAATETLEALLINGSYFGEIEETSLWLKAIRRVASYTLASTGGGSYRAWSDLRRYPVCRLLYGLGISSRAQQNYGVIWSALTDLSLRPPDEPLIRAALFHPILCTAYMPKGFMGTNYYLPGSEYLLTNMSPAIRELIPLEDDRKRFFDEFEYLWSLILSDQDEYNPFLGRFAAVGWRKMSRETGFRSEAYREKEHWQPLSEGLFDGSWERFLKADQRLKEVIERRPFF